jgi:hypothetical protein
MLESLSVDKGSSKLEEIKYLLLGYLSRQSNDCSISVPILKTIANERILRSRITVL